MNLNPLLLVAVCGVSLSLVACGSSNGPPGVDAAVTATGPHYQYVVSQISIPPMAQSAKDLAPFSLDIGSATSANTADGFLDNQLGGTLATLGALSFPIQPAITEAVDKGQFVTLVDMQTPDFTTAAGAAFTVKIGVSATAATGAPVPAPCSSATDLTCRHHLDGTGMFTVDASSPANATVVGPIIGGTYAGGPGSLTLQIVIGGPMPIKLSLINARVKATEMSATGMTAIVAGMVTTADLNNNILPAVHAQLAPIVDRDCPVPAGQTRIPPNCSCTGTGLLLMGLFDGKTGTPADCMISLDELSNNNTVKALLRPDVCGTASCPTMPDALSFGVQVKAVKAKF